MRTNAAPVSTANSALALAAVLGELARLLEGISDQDYVRRPSAEVSGSIGAHVRHCVDHVAVVLDHGEGGVISFDDRRRGTSLEQSRVLGLAALRRSVMRLQARAASGADEPVFLDARIDHLGTTVRVASSLGRELLYVLQHTIHHNAVIALLLASRGEAVPVRFGYAPSTPPAVVPSAAVVCAR